MYTLEKVTMSPLKKGMKGMICLRETHSPINHTVASLGTDEIADMWADELVKRYNTFLELLEACQKAKKALWTFRNLILYPKVGFTPSDHHAMDKLTEAIQKATGEHHE